MSHVPALTEEEVLKRKQLEGRRSGKTFRLILQALLRASEGSNVAFHSNTRAHAEHAFNMAASMTQGISGMKLLGRMLVVEFPRPGGFITFISPRSKKIGSYNPDYNIKTVLRDEC